MGKGDLRWYGIMQVYPISMIFIILILFWTAYTGTRYILESFAWYGIAKLAEFLDHQIYFLMLNTISGNTIKHLAAAIGIYSIIRYLRFRQRL